MSLIITNYLDLLRHRDELIRHKKNLLMIFFQKSIQEEIDITNMKLRHYQDRIRTSPLLLRILRGKYKKNFIHQVNKM